MFLVLIQYTKPFEEVAPHVPAHRAFLDTYYASGHLICSGPRKTKTGGIVLARGRDEAELRAIFAEDPYAKAGVASHEVIEFDAVKHAPDFAPFL